MLGAWSPGPSLPRGTTQPFLLDPAIPGVPTSFRTGYLCFLLSWRNSLFPSPSGLLIFSTYLSFHVPFPWEGGSVLSRLYAEVGGWYRAGVRVSGWNAVRMNTNEYPGALFYHCSVLGCSWGAWPAQCSGKSRISSCRTRRNSEGI